ncbi:MAG: O-antigen ligase family protein [Bacteriovoracaceae bacterium]|nr:O-antigen ligase family protein [Bacteriovoracaceae bacterium]
MLKLTFGSLFILSGGIFISFSLTALSHIFIVPTIIWSFYSKKLTDFKYSKSSLALFLLIIVSALSVIFNWGDIVGNPYRKIFKLKYFLIAIMAVYPLKYMVRNHLDQKKISLLLNLFLITTMIASVSGMIGLYSGFNPLRFKEACHVNRSCGMYGHYISYGYGIHFATLLILGLWTNRGKLETLVNSKLITISLIVNFVGMYLSYTRGALLSVIVCAPFLFLKKSKKLFLIVLIVTSFGFLAALQLSPRLKESFTSNQRLFSIVMRGTMVETAWKAFTEKPLLGWGYKNFEANSRKIKEKYGILYPWFAGHAHNNYFEHLASTGIFGLLFLILFKFYWLREMYARGDLIGELCFPIVLALIFTGLFQYTMGDGENLFFIMGAYSLSQLDRIKV